MIHVLAIITAKPGQRDAVLTHFHANIPAVLAEEGCIEFGPAVDAADGPASQTRLGADSFVVVEKWADMAALKAHSAAPHMAAYGARVKDLLAGRVIHVLSPAWPITDLLNSFKAVAVAAGLIPAGTQFNPFAGEVSFMIGAISLTDVGVTAYAGAARLLQSKDNQDAAASILAAEAYHAGALRTLLAMFGQQAAVDAISAVRARVGGGKNQGLSIPNVKYDIALVDSDGLVDRRTAAEVLGVVYTGRPTGGGFLPNQANGTIR